jgi:hypothetical protein
VHERRQRPDRNVLVVVDDRQTAWALSAAGLVEAAVCVGELGVGSAGRDPAPVAAFAWSGRQELALHPDWAFLATAGVQFGQLPLSRAEVSQRIAAANTPVDLAGPLFQPAGQFLWALGELATEFQAAGPAERLGKRVSHLVTFAGKHWPGPCEQRLTAIGDALERAPQAAAALVEQLRSEFPRVAVFGCLRPLLSGPTGGVLDSPAGHARAALRYERTAPESDPGDAPQVLTAQWREEPWWRALLNEFAAVEEALAALSPCEIDASPILGNRLVSAKENLERFARFAEELVEAGGKSAAELQAAENALAAMIATLEELRGELEHLRERLARTETAAVTGAVGQNCRNAPRSL